MNFQQLFRRRSTAMPDDVRHAFLEMLYFTLLSIRATKEDDIVFILSDHAHNLPRLIDSFTEEAFRYYWEVERPCFLQALERVGHQPFGPFQEYWAVLKRHYEGLSRNA